MSGARFAAHILDVIGLTPGDYLANWRISVAQRVLRKGQVITTVADAVGYSGPGALSRLFVQHLGLTPRQWLQTADPTSEAAATSTR